MKKIFKINSAYTISKGPVIRFRNNGEVKNRGQVIDLTENTKHSNINRRPEFDTECGVVQSALTKKVLINLNFPLVNGYHDEVLNFFNQKIQFIFIHMNVTSSIVFVDDATVGVVSGRGLL